jgi:hypothetical protein
MKSMLGKQWLHHIDITNVDHIVSAFLREIFHIDNKKPFFR